MHRVEDSVSMGALKSVNNIDIHYQYADFSVETPGYWKLRSYNDFDGGDLIKINGVPQRNYYHKQILKFDFSKYGDSFTDSVRITLTNLLNEAFVTLFAENQAYISAVTPGQYDAPLTYSLAMDEGVVNNEKCIYIIEDSQLDIGLLIAVERNVNRIFQIISDYLAWNNERIEESIRKQNAAESETETSSFDAYADNGKKKKGIFGRIGGWFKRVFGKIGGWIKGLFKRKKKSDVSDEGTDDGASFGDGGGLTLEQRKKAEKAAKKAAKQAEKEQKKAKKQEEKLRKEQEKAAKEAEKSADDAKSEEQPGVENFSEESQNEVEVNDNE
jgi:hypothetical protein